MQVEHKRLKRTFDNFGVEKKWYFIQPRVRPFSYHEWVDINDRLSDPMIYLYHLPD